MKTADFFRAYRHRNMPAARALNLARADMAAYTSHVAAGDTKAAARLARLTYFDPPSFGWSEDKPGHAYADKPEAFGLRLVGRIIPEASRRNGIWDNRGDCGWHTNPHGDVFRDGSGLCYGLVYQLPGRNGKSRFVAAYEFGGIDGGPLFDLSDIREHDTREYGYGGDVTDFAYDTGICSAADDMARDAAETEREYQTAWAAGSA